MADKSRINESSYAGTKWRKERTDHNATKQSLKELQKESSATIKSQDDKINAQASYIHDLETELQQRKEQESLIIIKDGKYITDITYTQAYNERIALQELSGINLLTITKTQLYTKFPFLYEEDNTIVIDIKRYNKYKLGGII